MAKSKRKSIGLSVDRGQFVKSVGYAVSWKGNVTARRWYLGAVDDGADSALLRAARIRQAWNNGEGVVETTLDGKTVKVWAENANPLGELARIAPIATVTNSGGRVDNGQTPNAAAVGTGMSEGAAVGGMTVADGRKLYLDNLERRFKAGQVSHGYWAVMNANIKQATAPINDSTPLVAFGAKALEDAVLAIAGRPVNRKRTDGQRISVRTAKSYLAALRDFLDEMSKTESAPGSEKPIWQKPLKFDEIFRRNQPQLTSEEKTQMLMDEEAEADAFSIDELVTLYSRASRRQKLWIALSLNCGFTQSELGSLTPLEIVGLDTDTPYVRRLRGKTDVFARWPLWRETAELLREFSRADNRTDANAPVVVSEGGKPLVEYKNMVRLDRADKSWGYLRTALPEGRQLSFKYLRKTGARRIRCHMSEVGGSEIAEMYLSHTDDKLGVLSAYSGRDWERLAKAVWELRKQLEPMFASDKWHAAETAIAEGRLADARALIPQ